MQKVRAPQCCLCVASTPAAPTTALLQAFRKAMEVLVMDLERNIKLLGTPERAQVGWN